MNLRIECYLRHASLGTHGGKHLSWANKTKERIEGHPRRASGMTEDMHQHVPCMEQVHVRIDALMAQQRIEWYPSRACLRTRGTSVTRYGTINMDRTASRVVRNNLFSGRACRTGRQIQTVRFVNSSIRPRREHRPLVRLLGWID